MAAKKNPDADAIRKRVDEFSTWLVVNHATLGVVDTVFSTLKRAILGEDIIRAARRVANRAGSFEKMSLSIRDDAMIDLTNAILRLDTFNDPKNATPPLKKRRKVK